MKIANTPLYTLYNLNAGSAKGANSFSGNSFVANSFGGAAFNGGAMNTAFRGSVHSGMSGMAADNVSYVNFTGRHRGGASDKVGEPPNDSEAPSNDSDMPREVADSDVYGYKQKTKNKPNRRKKGEAPATIGGKAKHFVRGVIKNTILAAVFAAGLVSVGNAALKAMTPELQKLFFNRNPQQFAEDFVDTLKLTDISTTDGHTEIVLSADDDETSLTGYAGPFAYIPREGTLSGYLYTGARATLGFDGDRLTSATLDLDGDNNPEITVDIPEGDQYTFSFDYNSDGIIDAVSEMRK